MATLLPNVVQRFLDSNGLPLVGGKLYSYVAGTSTPLVTYQNQLESVPNANPVILDANGEANVWISSGSYKFVLKDSLDNVQWTVDNVMFIGNGQILTAMLADGAVTTVKIADLAVTTAKIQDNAVTTAKIADSAITAIKIPDGTLEAAKLASDFDFSQVTSAIECVVVNPADYASSGLAHIMPVLPWSTPTLISNPTTIPTGNGRSSAWSPNGEYLAVGHDNSPRVSIYQRMGTIITKLADPSSVPGSSVMGVSWSPAGDMLAVALSSSPFYAFYKRLGNVFILMSTGSLSATVAGSAIAYSPNGQFVALGSSSASAPLSIGQMIAASSHGISTVGPLLLATAGGNTYSDAAVIASFTTPKGFINGNFTALDLQAFINDTLAAPSTSGISISAQPAGIVTGASWSPDGQFLAVSHATTPFVTIYQRAGLTFTKLSNPATLPPGNASGVAFSPSGEFLTVTHATTPYLTTYQRSGTTFTKLSDPATLPAGAAGSPSWSSNSKYLAIPHATSPYITIYSRASTTFTKLTNPTGTLSGQGTSAAWSPNNEFLAVTQLASPYVSVYQTASVFPTNSVLYVGAVPRV